MKGHIAPVSVVGPNPLQSQIRKKPYSTSIAPGVILQYRRNHGAGTWGVRLTTGKDKVYPLAAADDYTDADGRAALDYWQAQDAARAKAKQHEGSSEPVTVTKALDAYEGDLETRGGDSQNVKRARSHLPPDMLERTVTDAETSARAGLDADADGATGFEKPFLRGDDDVLMVAAPAWPFADCVGETVPGPLKRLVENAPAISSRLAFSGAPT